MNEALLHVVGLILSLVVNNELNNVDKFVELVDAVEIEVLLDLIVLLNLHGLSVDNQRQLVFVLRRQATVDHLQ